MIKTSYTVSLLLTAMMIGTAISLVKQHEVALAQEQVINMPFTGRISQTELCCNGVKLTLIQPPLSIAAGTFIFPWTNFIPLPVIGLGFYSWWSLATNTTVLGSSLPSGVCITIASECESSETVMWTIRQTGTNLLSTPIVS